MNRHHPEEAVSQVLGVALMVALAVLLAAVTAHTLLSTTGDLQTMKFVSVVGEKNENGTATFTIQGGEDLKTVTGIYLVYQNGTVEHLFGASPSAGATNISSSSVAGQRIVLAASFVDGTEMMILEKRF